MFRHWGQDEDVSTEASVTSALSSLGLPAGSILADTVSPENRPKLRAQIERARALRIFGAPMFFVGGEMFWGNDRLEEALEAARA